MDNAPRMPEGELLRSYLSQSSLKQKDLRVVLRSRGVFVGRNEREKIIPELVKTGLSPAEFNYFASQISTKEANPKITTRTIQASSSEKSLLDSLNPDLDIRNLIDTRFEDFKINGDPKFYAIDDDPNIVGMRIEVTRTDYSRSMHETTQNFESHITISREEASDQIVFTTSHTSDETKRICNLVSINAISDFKSAGLVSDKTQIVAIRFSDFTNSGRISFFKELALGPFSDVAKFLSAHDVGLSRTDDMAAPAEIEWAEDHIQKLSFQGKGLEELYFIQKESLSSFFRMYRIEAQYDVIYLNYKGTCSVLFEFSDFSTKQSFDSELIISVSNIDMHPTTFQPKGVVFSVPKVRETILNSIESLKIRAHQKHKIKDGIEPA